MKWIKYQVLQNIIDEEEILLEKKIGYSDANLVIAESEAYNGEYTVEEDEESFDKEPLAIELGGTGAKAKDDVKKAFNIPDFMIYAGGDDSNFFANVNTMPEPGVYHGFAKVYIEELDFYYYFFIPLFVYIGAQEGYILHIASEMSFQYEGTKINLPSVSMLFTNSSGGIQLIGSFSTAKPSEITLIKVKNIY